jgi:predicted metal-dependent hydrolase
MPAPLDAERWQESEAYLHGLDLFNNRFYWEAHEQLEGSWLAAGRAGPVADFLKGLIKLAAAGVKALEGRPEGVRSHASRAAELWREVRSATGLEGFLGFRLATLIALAEGIVRDGWPKVPPVLLPANPAAGPRVR